MQAQVGAAMAPMMKDTPMYKSYAAVAPDPAEFPTLLDRVGELMRTPYDWSADTKRLAMPVLLVYGDSDMFRLDHVVEFYRLLGGGLKDAGWQREHMSKNRLAILPNVTHYEMFMAPAMVTTVLPFLDDTQVAPSWAAQVATPQPCPGSRRGSLALRRGGEQLAARAVVLERRARVGARRLEAVERLLHGHRAALGIRVRDAGRGGLDLEEHPAVRA